MLNRYLLTTLALIALLFASSSVTYAQNYPNLQGDDASSESSESSEGDPSGEDQRGGDPSASGEDAGADDASIATEQIRQRRARVRASALRQIESGQDQIHIYQLVEEMTDELTADMSALNAAVVSPIAFRKIGLSPNLSAQFGSFVEATVLSSVATHTDVTVKRCTACHTLRSRTENGNWVVTMGIVDQRELAQEAKRLGVRNFLNLHFSFFPQANIVAMQVEIMRASDGAILWTEVYRSDATTASILRTGDRVLTRAERVEELNRKLEQRPDFGYMAYFGTSHIPYDIPGGGITGAAGGIRLHEYLGAERRWRYGIGAEGFANFGSGSSVAGQPSVDALVGAFMGASVHYRIFPEHLNEAAFWTGPTLSGFLAGSEGNSFAVEWGAEGIFQFRLGAGLSLMYFVPVKFAERDLGGFGYKARVSFNW